MVAPLTAEEFSAVGPAQADIVVCLRGQCIPKVDITTYGSLSGYPDESSGAAMQAAQAMALWAFATARSAHHRGFDNRAKELGRIDRCIRESSSDIIVNPAHPCLVSTASSVAPSIKRT